MSEGSERHFVPEGDLTPNARERRKPKEDSNEARDYSKQERQNERAELANEVWQKRSELQDSRQMLKARIDILQYAIADHELLSTQRDTLTAQYIEARNKSADSIMDQIRGMLGIRKKSEIYSGPTNRSGEIGVELKVQLQALRSELQEAKDELVDADEGIRTLRTQIKEHYEASEDAVQVTVQKTMSQQQVFFAHSFVNERLVDNSTRNVNSGLSDSERLALLLTLEPSISASTIKPGSGQKLISNTMGVLIAGGDISLASPTDAGTTAFGIQKRGIERDSSSGKLDKNYSAPSPEDITKAINHEGAEDSWKGWNEFVIDRPKILGFFVAGYESDNGSIKGVAPWGKEEMAQTERKRFQELTSAGLPYYAMMPDGRFFSVKEYNEDNTLDIGEELLPENASQAPAGLSPEKRKMLGGKLIEDKGDSLFKAESYKLEARSIIDKL